MKKTASETREKGFGWTEVSNSAVGMANACPKAEQDALLALLDGVPSDGCVWRSELSKALKGCAQYHNWLSVAGFDSEVFAEHGVETAIPAFVVRQFASAIAAYPPAIEAELEAAAGVEPLVISKIDASMPPLELEATAILRAHQRKCHHHAVCQGLLGKFYRVLRLAANASPAVMPDSQTTVASEGSVDTRSFADQCIKICQDVASMYPKDLAPTAGTPEHSAFAMARRTAENIEARIKELAR